LGVDYIVGPIGGTYDWGLPTGSPAPLAPPRPPAIVTALPNGSGATNPPAPATSPAAPGADHLLRLTNLARTVAGAEFQFATEAGKQYRLEGTTDLTRGPWEVLVDNVQGTGGALQVQDPGALGLQQYFYRIITRP